MRVAQVEKLIKSHDNDIAMGDNIVLYKNQRKTTHKSNTKLENTSY